MTRDSVALTVADDEAVVFEGASFRRYEGLEPDHDYELDGVQFRTLPRPGGERLEAKRRRSCSTRS